MGWGNISLLATDTAVLSLVGFTVGFHEVSSGVRCGFGEEDGSVGRGCAKALKMLFVEALLDGGDKLFLCGALAES